MEGVEAVTLPADAGPAAPGNPAYSVERMDVSEVAAAMADEPVKNPNIETFGKVRVDRSGLLPKFGKNVGKDPLSQGCQVVGEAPPEEEDCTTYNVLGKDIPLDPNQTELVLSTARIQKLVNLDMIGENLRTLKLIANNIQRIEGLETLKNLEHLELYQNQIKKIENLECLPSLVHLDLSFNGIRKWGCLNGDIVFAKQLQRLFLPNNKIEDIPEELGKWFPQLEVLELGANRLRTIGGALEGLTKLQELWLGKNKLDSMAMAAPLPSLHTCSVQCNRLEAWDESFFQNCPGLKKLYVSENRLSCFDFGTTFQHVSALEELDLSHNIIDTLPKTFKLEQLRELWMNANKVDFVDENSEQISGLWNLKLNCLYLEHNPCWDGNYKDGGETYKRILRKVCGPTLKQLDAIVFEIHEQMEQDLYGTIYAGRDNSVAGIRKV